MHWRAAGKKGITGGRAFNDVDRCLTFVKWATNHPDIIHDIYFCTSLQKEHGEETKSGFKAERSAENAISSKLLFADVDKYGSKEEAVAAVKAFCEASRSPYPTSLVDSGNGLHIYWILPYALGRDEWIILAAKLDGLLTQFGLRHDNVTTDMARILRVPETYNFKQEPCKPVVLWLLNGDVDLINWASLHNATPTPAKVHRPAPRNDLHLPTPADISISPKAQKGRPSQLFARHMPIDERIEGGALDPAPFLQLCPMFRETFAAGGEGVGQPLWHQQALACTFVLGGKELFHGLGCKHHDYSRETTDAMYDRKLVDRYTKGLGYPSCATFEANGSVQCKSCEFKGKVVSPLNLKADKLPHASAPAFPVAEPPRIKLPENFAYGDDIDKPDAHAIFAPADSRGKHWIMVIATRLHSANLYKEEKGEGMGLCIDAQTNQAERHFIHITNDDFEKSDKLYARLNRGGCGVTGEREKTYKLFTGFRARLQQADKALRAVQYGWVAPSEKPSDSDEIAYPAGFAFHGQIFQRNGQTVPSAASGDELQEVYRQYHDEKPWFKALRYILMTKRPELQVLVLAGFAAPLVKFTGQNSVAIMAVGESGAVKSAATAVGLAVWANPKLASQKPSASINAIRHRMGVLRHLPTAWDDLQSEDFENSKKLIMEITQGADGAKLTTNREERKQGTWDTVIVTTSNSSVAEYIERKNKNDCSGLARCFEFAVPKLQPTDEGFQDQAETSRIFSHLNENYGHMGVAYARKLGADPAKYDERTQAAGRRITARVGRVETEERFWYAAATAITAGAISANELLEETGYADLRFDVSAVEDFVVKTYVEMRERVEDAKVKSESDEFPKRHLEMFFNHWAFSNNTVVFTQTIADKPGRQIKIRALRPVGDKYLRMNKVTVRFVEGPMELYISRFDMEEYCKKHEISINNWIKGLKKFYQAEPRKVSLGGGLADINISVSQEPVIWIKVHPGKWLHQALQAALAEDELPENVIPLPRRNPDQ
jgi:hypothetical protein